MKNYLKNFDNKLLTVIGQIGKAAERNQFSAYIVGGIVRDILLKKKNLDLDILVEGDAIYLAKGLAKKWRGRITVHKKFRTASLEMPKGLRIDFATARKECYSYSGALPIVQSGSLKEDLFRRDFTVNAMAIAINPGCFGRLIDEFGGLNDLSKKMIRVLHDRSFIDDPTRILRAVRFEQRFSFRMERQTLQLMKSALQKKIPLNVKPPRYFNEFKKILCEADPLKCLKRLHQLDGLYFFGPKLKVRMRDLSLLHRRVQKAQRKPLYSKWDWWLVYFMGLVAKADDRMVEHCLKNFSFTKKERVSIQKSRESSIIVRKLSIQNLPPSEVFQILKPLTIETILYLRVATSRQIVLKRIDRFLSHDKLVKICIDGEDLKKAGITSGSQMGRALKDVLYLKIDKKLKTKRDELKAALSALR